MIEYILKSYDDTEIKYVFRYDEHKQKHLEFMDMSDKKFLKNIKEAIHHACAISYFKELSLEAIVGDQGIIHRLVHIMNYGHGNEIDKESLQSVRKQFNETLNLD